MGEFHFFGFSFLILILILLLIRMQEGVEIKIKIRIKIKRGTQKCEMHPGGMMYQGCARIPARTFRLLPRRTVGVSNGVRKGQVRRSEKNTSALNSRNVDVFILTTPPRLSRKICGDGSNRPIPSTIKRCFRERGRPDRIRRRPADEISRSKRTRLCAESPIASQIVRVSF